MTRIQGWLNRRVGRAALFGIACGALAGLGCGGGSGSGTGGTGGAGGSGSGDRAAFLAACGSYCDGTGSLGCPMSQTAQACKESLCPKAADDYPRCHSVGADMYSCWAEGPFACDDNGYAHSGGENKACLDQQVAYFTCVHAASCDRYCEATKALDCGDPDVEACYQACSKPIFDLRDCAPILGGYRACLADSSPVCQGGHPAADACSTYARNAGNCLITPDWMCEGFCIAISADGCAYDACEDSCAMEKQEAAAVSQQCQNLFQSYLGCLVQNGVTCDGGTIASAACDQAKTAYETCLQGG